MGQGVFVVPFRQAGQWSVLLVACGLLGSSQGRRVTALRSTTDGADGAQPGAFAGWALPVMSWCRRAVVGCSRQS